MIERYYIYPDGTARQEGKDTFISIEELRGRGFVSLDFSKDSSDPGYSLVVVELEEEGDGAGYIKIRT